MKVTVLQWKELSGDGEDAILAFATLESARTHLAFVTEELIDSEIYQTMLDADIYASGDEAPRMRLLEEQELSGDLELDKDGLYISDVCRITLTECEVKP